MSLDSGRRTAKQMYGARGFVFHHNIDAWGDTAPVDYGYVGIWPMGAAWLALHYWEHYRYGLDRAFLGRDAYPVMKEASQFLLDFLIDDGKGQLITNPSYSPENSYRTADGTVGRQTIGATMDYEIIYSLFNATIDAATILGLDADYRAELRNALARIPTLKIGKHGQLQEWSEDYDEAEPGMGHVSHLFALFPADQITLRGTPELARAARVSLERRVQNGAGERGWPAAWFVNLWARLEDGDRAHQHVRASALDLGREPAERQRALVPDRRQPRRRVRNRGDAPAESRWRDRVSAGTAGRRGRKASSAACARAATWRSMRRGGTARPSSGTLRPAVAGRVQDPSAAWPAHRDDHGRWPGDRGRRV